MKRWMMIAALLIGFGMSTSYAQGYRSADHAPQYAQRARIHQGVRSGELNRREARNLNRQQLHIRKMEKMAAADGKITRKEKRMLKNERAQANRNIRRKKHNCR